MRGKAKFKGGKAACNGMGHPYTVIVTVKLTLLTRTSGAALRRVTTELNGQIPRQEYPKPLHSENTANVTMSLTSTRTRGAALMTKTLEGVHENEVGGGGETERQTCDRQAADGGAEGDATSEDRLPLDLEASAR